MVNKVVQFSLEQTTTPLTNINLYYFVQLKLQHFSADTDCILHSKWLNYKVNRKIFKSKINTLKTQIGDFPSSLLNLIKVGHSPVKY